MLQRLDLTNTRSVLFEKANKRSQLMQSMTELLNDTYYFKWPEYPETTLFYRNDQCVFQRNDWFELYHVNFDITKTYTLTPYSWNMLSDQEEIGKVLQKILNIPQHYYFDITRKLPIATTSFVRGSIPTAEEERRNKRYVDLKILSFDEQILRGAGIISRLNDYRTDLLKNLLYKRILARH